MEQLQEMIQDRLKKDGFDTYQALWLEQETLCYIINYKKKAEEELLLSIESSARRAGQIAEKILFVVSRPLTDFTYIKNIYEKRSKALSAAEILF